MRRIALVNQKGGVGKTTCCVNIGAGLSKLKKKVLLVDLDPQAHLTCSLGLNADELECHMYHLFMGQAEVKDVVVERGKLHVLPSSIQLAGLDMEVRNLPGREFLLKQRLEQLERYDFVLIDCPPNLGLLTLNAFTFCRELFLPVQTQFLSLQGVSILLDTIEVVRKRLNGDLNVTGVIPVMYSRRKRLANEVLTSMRDFFGDKVFKTALRENVALAEAPGFGKTIFEYRPRSLGAADFLALCREILKR